MSRLCLAFSSDMSSAAGLAYCSTAQVTHNGFAYVVAVLKRLNETRALCTHVGVARWVRSVGDSERSLQGTRYHVHVYSGP
jgi:hypothetical protein